MPAVVFQVDGWVVLENDLLYHRSLAGTGFIYKTKAKATTLRNQMRKENPSNVYTIKKLIGRVEELK